LSEFTNEAIKLSKNLDSSMKPQMESELSEQESTDTGGGASATPTSTVSTNAGVSTGYPKVTKWDDRTNPTKRGKANPLGKSGEKWSSNLTRGVANNLF
jgi:hypothetical protein